MLISDIDHGYRGTQRLYRFDNGYGASVVQSSMSYGTELAVIKWDGEDWDLCYDTPITSDVIGWLSQDHLEVTLTKSRHCDRM